MRSQQGGAGEARVPAQETVPEVIDRRDRGNPEKNRKGTHDELAVAQMYPAAEQNEEQCHRHIAFAVPDRCEEFLPAHARKERTVGFVKRET